MSCYKYCIVPRCGNTSVTTPEKLFFCVPKDTKIREKWCSIMRRVDPRPLSIKTTLYCCEDHFDVERDMENYQRFKMMGGVKTLKKGVVPHKFACQGKENRTVGKTCQSQSNEEEMKPEQDVVTEEMIEVKIEVEEQSYLPPDPLLGDAPDSTGRQSFEAIIKEEPLDIEEAIIQRDPSLEQELERYRKLYNKIKEEVTRLEVENQRLADENQLLSAKLRGFTNRIEDLLQKHEKRKGDEQTVKEIESVVITNLKMDKHKLTEKNKELLKKIDDLLKQVNKQTEEIQELSEVNKQLTVKLEVYSKENNITRTAEEVNVFVQKIKILSDDVKRLEGENEAVRREIEDLTRRNKEMTGRIENVKGTYKFKRKHTSVGNDITDTDDNIANIAPKHKRKHNRVDINKETAEENITKETHRTKRKQALACREFSEERETEKNIVKEIVKRKQELTHRKTTNSLEVLELNGRTRKR